ncbi:hypothetical protein EC973_006294 [Apophysomyces ossiformis]|uniref:Uncharacterized protein n=1 Tax=Apophysomyces ossiformis TaxID=679940 RepID=A0A8H7BQW4_9FUNG|nr:hypothetical protein EC973_006294 [Apophysomyces ossiformis]
MSNTLLLVASFIAFVSACHTGRNITYNVVLSAGEQQTVAVVVDSKVFPLKQSSHSVLLYTGEAPRAKKSYNYAKFNGSELVEQEAFLRDAVKLNTPNQFYNRTWDTVKPAKLPNTLPPMSAMNRVKSKLHLNDQIVTIHIEADEAAIERMHKDPMRNTEKVPTKLTYISLNEAQTFADVEFELAGNNARWFSKLTYNLKFPKKQLLAGYRSLKLRSLITDPSYIREKTVYDIMQSAGVATTQFSYARVYINKKPYGLFGIVENYKNPWLENEFANGQKEEFERGILYQGRSRSFTTNLSSNLEFRGDNQTLYADDSYKIKVDPAKGQPIDYTRLMEFTKFLANAPTTGSDVVNQWEKHIDTQSMVRNLALEILLGFADGYISNANNFYLYDNRERQQFVFIPSDTDYSLGSTFTKLSDMWTGNYHDFPGMSLKRPLFQKMLEVPQLKKQFEELLVKLTKELLNPKRMNPYIDSLVNMIREDVTWDQMVPRYAESILKDVGAGQQDPQNVDPNMFVPPTDMETTIDIGMRATLNNVNLDMAVNGPTGYISLAPVKEWFARQSEATLKYLNAA